MKYSIEDLRNGKVALINDGTVEELRRVLKEAFTIEKHLSGNCPIYEKGIVSWTGCYNTILPKQSVKDFLKEESMEEEFKWGEEVECSDNSQTWFNGVYVGKSTYNEKYPNIIENANSESGCSYWKYIRKPLKKTELTRQQIAEKFNIPVEQLVIKD